MRFLTLRKSGSASVNGSTGLFANGTAAAPSMSFLSDQDTGFYRYGANSVGVALGGSLYFRFQTGGILGRNTDSGINMDGVGAVSIFAAGTAQNITLTPSTTGVVNLIGNNVSPLWLTKGTGAGGIVFSFNGTTYLSSITTSESGAAANCYMDLGVATGANTTTQQVLRLIGNGRALVGTLTDSGALLQVGANAATGYALAGMSFGGDTFLYRSAAGILNLAQPAGGNSELWFETNSSNKGKIVVTNAGNMVLVCNASTALTLDSSQNATFAGTIAVGQYTTAGAPAYAKGKIYFDATLKKLCVGGAAAWETITSV